MKVIAIVIFVALSILCAASFIRSAIQSDILYAHTSFLLVQIEEILKEEENIPTSIESLITILKDAEIDWNSCVIKENEILDGWGNPISFKTSTEERKWTLQSSGKNRNFGDSDDIIRNHQRTNQPD